MAGRQQALTTTYERLVQAADVSGLIFDKMSKSLNSRTLMIVTCHLLGSKTPVGRQHSSICSVQGM